jgi:RHS repeat-associated protein
LYSGEQFDSKIGQQYLRARYYDPATGRFNRLDPFFGNLNDPQSLHKYLYTCGDPITYTDPNGEMSIGVSMAMSGAIIGGISGAAIGAYRDGWRGALIGGISGAVAGGTVGYLSPALAAFFGTSTLGTLGFDAATGGIFGLVNGGIYGTLLKNGKFTFSPMNGVGLAITEGAMGAVTGGVLGLVGKLVFGVTPRPTNITNTRSSQLKDSMIKLIESPFFRLRAEMWSRMTGRGKINWNVVMKKLEQAEYVETSAVFNGGWAGLNEAKNKWYFAISEKAWFGNGTKSHELIHALQDASSGIFSQQNGPFATAALEAQAHVFRNSLWGVPFMGGIGIGMFMGIDYLLDTCDDMNNAYNPF